MQTRYTVDKDWERDWCMKVMGDLWRSSKSRLVTKLNELPNEQERLKLKPDNIKSETEWRVFVREKTSKQFQVTKISIYVLYRFCLLQINWVPYLFQFGLLSGERLRKKKHSLLT